MDNQKNLLLAVVFSLIILIGFDFFFAPKKSEINKVQLDEKISEEILDKNTPSIDSSLMKKSNENKSSEKRIKFKANRIEGSINLFGATIDEIILSDYFQTIEKKKKSMFFRKKVVTLHTFLEWVGHPQINP